MYMTVFYSLVNFGHKKTTQSFASIIYGILEKVLYTMIDDQRVEIRCLEDLRPLRGSQVLFCLLSLAHVKPFVRDCVSLSVKKGR